MHRAESSLATSLAQLILIQQETPSQGSKVDSDRGRLNGLEGAQAHLPE